MFEFTKAELKKLSDLVELVKKSGVRHFSINLLGCKVAFYINK